MQLCLAFSHKNRQSKNKDTNRLRKAWTNKKKVVGLRGFDVLVKDLFDRIIAELWDNEGVNNAESR